MAEETTQSERQRRVAGRQGARENRREQMRRNSMLLNYPGLAQDFLDYERAAEYERLTNIRGTEWARNNLPSSPAFDLLEAQHKAGKLLIEAAKAENDLVKNMQPQNKGEVFKAILNYSDSIHGSRASATGGVAQAGIRAESAMAGKAFDQLVALDQAENDGVGTALPDLISMNVMLGGISGQLSPDNRAEAQAFAEAFHKQVAQAPDADQAALRLTKLSTLSGLSPAQLQEIAVYGSTDTIIAEIQGMGGEITNRAADRIARRAQAETQAASHIQKMRRHAAATRDPEVMGMIDRLWGPLITGEGLEDVTPEQMDYMLETLGLQGGLETIPESATQDQLRQLAADMVKVPASVALENSIVIGRKIIASDDMRQWAAQRGYNLDADPGAVFQRGRQERKARKGEGADYEQATWAYNVNNGIIPASLGQRLAAKWIQGREMLDGFWGEVFSENTYARVVADKEGKTVGQVIAENTQQIEQARAQGLLTDTNPPVVAVATQGTPEDQQIVATAMEETPAAIEATSVEEEAAAAPAEAEMTGMDALWETARKAKEGARSTVMAGGANINPLLLVEAVQQEHPEASQEEVVAALEGSEARTGTDGWAEYTLHPDGRITFTNPSTGREQTVTERQAGAYWAIREKAFGEQLSGQQRAAVSQAQQGRERRSREIDPNNPYWPPGVPTRAEAFEGSESDKRRFNDWAAKSANAPGTPGSEEWNAWAKGQPEFIGTNLGVSPEEWEAQWASRAQAGVEAGVQEREEAESRSMGPMDSAVASEVTEFDKIMEVVAALRAGGSLPEGTPEARKAAAETVLNGIPREAPASAGGYTAATIMSLGAYPVLRALGATGSDKSNQPDVTGMEVMAKLLKEYGTSNPDAVPNLRTAIKLYAPELEAGLFAPEALSEFEQAAARAEALKVATPGEGQIGSEALMGGFDADPVEGEAPAEEAPAPAPSPAPAEAASLAPQTSTPGQADTTQPGGDPFAGLSPGQGAEVAKEPDPTPGPAGAQMPTEADMAGTPPAGPPASPEEGEEAPAEYGEEEALGTSEQQQFYQPSNLGTSEQPKDPPGKDKTHPGAPRKEQDVDYGGNPPGGLPTSDQPDSFSGLTPGVKSSPGVTAYEAQAHNIKPASTSAAAAFPPGMAMAQGATGSATSPRARYNDAIKKSIAQQAMNRTG